MEFDYSNEPGKKQFGACCRTAVTPFVSIITAYYNAGEYIEQTFFSVMNQTFPWFEWIIVNDGSTDRESVDRLKQISERDSRIKILNKENGGIASARNLGIHESSTEYVVPLDADDLITPTYLEKLFWALYFEPGAAWAYTDVVGFQGQQYLWKKTFSSEIMKRENLLTCTAMIRKSALEQIGLYEEVEKHYNEDWMAWLKLLAEKQYPVHVNGYDFWYRRTDTGVLSAVKNDVHAKELIARQAELITESVEAKEFPSRPEINGFLAPKVSEWKEVNFVNNDKISMLLVFPWMEMGGADQFNLDIVRRIDKDKFTITIITTLKAENEWRNRFEECTPDIHHLPDFLDTADYAEYVSYLIKSRNIHVIFLSNSYYGYYLMPWIKVKFPKIAVIDYVHMEEWYWRNGGYARLSGVSEWCIDKTYVCNNKTRRVLIDHFKRREDSVETLYVGVDKERFDSEKIAYGEIRERFGIPKDKKVILFPCRIHPQKRPFFMFEIAKKVIAIRNDICFLVAGDGAQWRELKEEIEHSGFNDYFVCPGQIDEMEKVYRDSNLTLICSLKEGLSLTAYESCAMRTPVITSDVGGQSELIDESVGRVIPLLQEETQIDNRIYSDEEVQLYVNAIIDLLEDEEQYRMCCDNCRKKITEQFSTDIMIKNLEKEIIRAVENVQAKTSDFSCFCGISENYLTTYVELENYDKLVNLNYEPDTNYELKRIANSKWGRRLIRVMMKVKLNRLFR